MLFLYLKRNGLRAATDISLPYLHLQRGGLKSSLCLEISPTLVQLFYDNIMISLATDLLQQFYTHPTDSL
jgi:hypothetical protein